MVPFSWKSLNINNIKGFKVYLISWIWITASLIVNSVYGDDCLKGYAIHSRIMKCLHTNELASVLESLPALNKAQWKHLCSLYGTSMACVRAIPKACPGEFKGEFEEINVGKILESGLGTLCHDDADTFDVYETHVGCYTDNAHQLAVCYSKFINDTQKGEHICSAFDEYLTCDKLALLECGNEGMTLYQSVLIAQVPAYLIDMCNIKPVYLPSKSHNGSSRIVSSSLYNFIVICVGVSLLL